MKPFSRTLVALSLVALIAAACGGREEDNTTPAKAAKPPAPAADVVNSDGQLNITPEQAEKLRILRENHIKKTPPAPPKIVVTRIESSDGSAIELPGDFPSDIPILPGSIPTQHVTSPATGTMTIFQTNEGLESARRFTTNGLTDQGWSITSDKSSDELSVVIAEKDGRELSFAIMETDGGTKITTIQN